MFSVNNKISLRQLQVLLILDIFGIGITVLPRRCAEFGGQDGWISVIIGLVFALVCLYIITSLASMFSNEGFVDYTSRIIGKPLGILISFGFIFKIIISLSLELRVFGEILKQIMLFNTPFWVISICMLLLGAYAASKGYEARGRIAEILVFVVFIPLIIVFSFAIRDTDFSNLKPFFTASKSGLLKGGIISLFSFSGIEFLLLAYPYLAKPKSAQKSSIKALIFVGMTMLIITIITIARFGIYDITHQMWPTLEIMDTVNIPGSFIERQDALMMSFWIISIFLVINAGMFFSSIILKDIFKKGTHGSYIMFTAPIIYLISFIPSNINDVYKFIDILNISFGTAYLFIIPLILIITAKVRKLENSGGETHEKN